MSSYNGRKVLFAKLHSVIHVPNIGQFGPTLTDAGDGANKAVSMVMVGNDIIEATVRGSKTVISIPTLNCTHFVLEALPAQALAVPKAK